MLAIELTGQYIEKDVRVTYLARTSRYTGHNWRDRNKEISRVVRVQKVLHSANGDVMLGNETRFPFDAKVEVV